MLTISTISEALAELEKSTRRAWTESELFDLAANCGVELYAAPPITARTTIQKFVIGEGMVEKFRSGPGHARLAVLFPWQVGQLWLSGETMVMHTEKYNQVEDEYQFFTEPVRVTREQVRIKAATLQKMLVVWSQAQAGRWVENDKKPGDMKYQIGPDWMFPIVPQQSAPAQTTLPAPVEALGASGGVEPDKAGPVDKGWVMKKAALIKKHTAQWPTIERDFRGSSENDLSKVAKAPGHGDWFEAAALNWAEQRGKLEKEQSPTNPATVWTGRKHTI